MHVTIDVWLIAAVVGGLFVARVLLAPLFSTDTKPLQAPLALRHLLARARRHVGCLLRRQVPPSVADSLVARGKLLYTVEEVEKELPPDSWQRISYDQFKATILGRGEANRTFPCVYATRGYKDGEHRYVFVDTADLGDRERSVAVVGPALREYLSVARELGDNTSLVIMGRPAAVTLDVGDFNASFWRLLRRLHQIEDTQPWPHDLPTSLHDSKWTFAYEGVPLFPVSLSPAFDRRWSRHAPVPLVALQPKWILDKLLATPEKREAAQAKVRKLLEPYDLVGVSPDLTSYGTEGTSEAHQLALLDENDSAPIPYDTLDATTPWSRAEDKKFSFT